MATDVMMSAGVVKVPSMSMHTARSRIGPLLAALVIILLANGAVRAWHSFQQNETRQHFNRLSGEVEILSRNLKQAESRLKSLEADLEANRRLVENLDREIAKKKGNERLNPLARRDSIIRLYKSQAEDYRLLYRRYDEGIGILRKRHEELNRLADQLGLPWQGLPVRLGESPP